MSEADRQVGIGGSLTDGIVDLLGVLAYGELSAFDRLAEDARHAPTLAGRAALSEMAAAEITHYGLLEAFLAEHGVRTDDAMGPFVRAFDSFPMTQHFETIGLFTLG